MGNAGGEHQLPAANKPSTVATILTDSFKILHFNPKLFTCIFLLFALPLSFLLSSLSLSTATLRRRISHLQSLASLITVRIEALNILEEARKDSKSLFRLRALYAPPTLLLSTLLLVSSASSVAAPLLHRRRLSLLEIPAAVKSAWWRGLLTAVLGHVAIAGSGQLMRSAAVAADSVSGPAAGVAVGLASGAFEIYATAVFGVAAVVSVVEERFGLDAVRAAWGLMEGRRAAGWAAMAAVGAVTGVIGWEMVGMEEIDVYGGDYYWKEKGLESTAVIEYGRKLGVVLLYALVIMWSNMLFTVFYCDCKRNKLVSDDAHDYDDQPLVHISLPI